MAQANIDVNKQTVLELLQSGQETPFSTRVSASILWGDDEISTLFDDIWSSL